MKELRLQILLISQLIRLIITLQRLVTTFANKIPCFDINPISYISPVNIAFSFAVISLESDLKTLKSIDPNEATGPDNISNITIE